MASGGSSTRSASGRAFDYGSDDVLCSYDDYTLQKDQTVNGKRSDTSAKDLHESRVGRPLTNLYSQPDEFSRDDVISAVENCMKKYADNLTRNLEGISGRLTQLELYCFKLERSIGEFRADMVHEQSEADLKLKSLEKHIHEVHRSVQIIRDKQELHENQKELAKLMLSPKEPTNSSHSQRSNEGLTAAAPEIKAHNDDNDTSNLQLALALPHQTAPTDQNQPFKEPPMQQPAPTSLTLPPQDRYVLNQANSYYSSHQPLPLEQQSQNIQPELHYAHQRAQMHDHSIQASATQQVNAAPNLLTQQPPFSQYRPQWSQVMQPQQPSSQAQAPRPQNPSSYARYSSNQPSNTIQAEAYQGSSMAPPASYIAVPQSSGYGVSGSTISHLPSQHNMQRQPLPQAGQVSFGPPPLAKSGYIGTHTYPSQPNMPAYNAVYVIDGNRASHPHYPPPNSNIASPQTLNNHPYGEMIEKAVSMGYPRDQVVGVLQGLAESGQPLDLNTLLDRLNAIAGGGMRRPWSG